MKLLSRWSIVFLVCIFSNVAFSQEMQSSPGLQRYTPTRIEWLALLLNSHLRQDMTSDNLFNLAIVNSDHETITIFVRYQPNVNREIMNMTIDGAREMTKDFAKMYGWEKWVKIKEKVEMVKRKKEKAAN